MSRPKGFKHSEATRQKMSESSKGYIHSLDSRLKMSLSKTGKSWGKHTLESKIKIGKANSLALTGLKRPWGAKENSPHWKGGVTPINEAIRKSLDYRLWRKAVFERDHYTCQECYIRGSELHADHIKPFAYFPELRLVTTNGRTLCKECHLKTETYSHRYKYENI